MFEIEVRGGFTAVHFLRLYDGSLEEPHSHDWKVSVFARADKLDRIGVVMDFEVLKPALSEILHEFNGGSVNTHPAFAGEKSNSSAENIAGYIFEQLKKRKFWDHARLTKVTVWETPEGAGSVYADIG